MIKLLDSLRLPDDIKGLNLAETRRLAAEIREFLVGTVSRMGGHLASNLGVVELTLALYRAFDFPNDKIVWDVGHQAYVHKILSGRLNAFDGLRRFGGLSGFPKRDESPFDHFNTGHSSTSISAALGIARARDLQGGNYRVISVTGDGALTGGLCYEAMNDAGHSPNDLIVILNDNEMSISGNVGSVSRHLSRVRSLPAYFSLRDDIHSSLDRLPVVGRPVAALASRLKNILKYAIIPGVLFEELGFRYIGPVDGHDLRALERILGGVAAMRGPVLVHVLTKKGMGYARAESDPTKYHGVAPGTPDEPDEPGKLAGRGGIAVSDAGGNAPPRGNRRDGANGIAPASSNGDTGEASFSGAFGSAMCALAEKDPGIVAISAAMTDGTGLDGFSRAYPDRFFDVGIAEQHALTLAAGMSLYGLRPVAALYSTFLQRAYDQALHDLCLQNAHVVIAVDRAGVAGADGETHQGLYDIAFLRHMPNMTVLAPSHDGELARMLRFALYDARGPVAIRYPKSGSGAARIAALREALRSASVTVAHASETASSTDGSAAAADRMSESGGFGGESLRIGRGELIRRGGDITLVAVGALLDEALVAAAALVGMGRDVELIAARFVKPLDAELIAGSVKKTGRLLVVEDGCAAGGFGGAVLECLAERGVNCAARLCAFPDEPVPQGERRELLKIYGLTAESLIQKSLALCP